MPDLRLPRYALRATRYLLPPAALLFAASLLAQPQPTEPPPLLLVRAARAFVGLPCRYDGAYRVLIYPGGDPGGGLGVCSDLVVRSYRALGIDLQVRVHEDMKKYFNLYPARALYQQVEPDTNIDHRRVPNLMTFFKRHGLTLPNSIEPALLKTWQPGDIVVWDLLQNGIPSHLGIVSDRKAPSGLPLILHHFPPFPAENDCLTKWKVVGHFRYFPVKKPTP